MISWQKILREETFSVDFELSSDNDKYIVDGVISSYKSNLTANYHQVKEILDGAYLAGFKLAKRRYTSKTVYVLIKSYKNAHTILQFSIQPKTLIVCEVVYGMSGEQLIPNAKRSKYFPTIYNSFDKTLPLDFMNVIIDKEHLEKDPFISIQNEYEWSEYFDYLYSFMIVMLEKLNDGSEHYLEESQKEEIQTEENKFSEVDTFVSILKEFHSDLRVESEVIDYKNEAKIFIEWRKTYNDQTEENKNKLNIIISKFIDDIKDAGHEVDLHRARTSIELIRTLFIKYK